MIQASEIYVMGSKASDSIITNKIVAGDQLDEWQYYNISYNRSLPKGVSIQ